MNKIKVATTSSHIVPLYCDAVKFFLKIRNESGNEASFQRVAVNMNIVLNSAIFLESALCEGLLSYMHLTNWRDVRKDHAVNILLEKLENEIQNATNLDKISEYYRIITGKKLNQIVDNANWEAVVILTGLRNMFAHGKRMSTPLFGDTYERGEVDQRHYDNAFKFLLKKNIVNYRDEESEQFWPTDFMKDKVADWSWEVATSTILKLAKVLNVEEHHIFPVYDIKKVVN